MQIESYIKLLMDCPYDSPQRPSLQQAIEAIKEISDIIGNDLSEQLHKIATMEMNDEQELEMMLLYEKGGYERILSTIIWRLRTQRNKQAKPKFWNNVVISINQLQEHWERYYK